MAEYTVKGRVSTEHDETEDELIATLMSVGITDLELEEDK